MRAARRAVAGEAHGRVLEIGVGVGANWPHLPQGIHYTGIEPDAYMLERARGHAAEEGRVVDLQQASAEQLPFDDATFDTIIVTLTFCSVGDLSRSLAEAMRVLKPGGELRFWEHVAADHGAKARVLDAITPLWRRVAAGCEPNRRTESAVRAAGFDVRIEDRSSISGLPAIRGVATKPGSAA